MTTSPFKPALTAVDLVAENDTPRTDSIVRVTFDCSLIALRMLEEAAPHLWLDTIRATVNQASNTIDTGQGWRLCLGGCGRNVAERRLNALWCLECKRPHEKRTRNAARVKTG